MNKPLLLILIIVVIVLGVLACNDIAKPVEEEGPLFILITDGTDLIEEGYNDLALQGFERAEAELGVRIEMIQPDSREEYLSSIKIAVDKGASLIVCNGGSMTDAVKAAATEYPDQAFALIDGTVDAPNVSSYIFIEEDGAFLAGVAAATMSETNIIGFIWDIQNPQSEKYQYGFEAGVESASDDAQVLINYINIPGDELLCKETALAQNKLGVDVIFHEAGHCGDGVIKATVEQDFWVIGMNKGQSILSPEKSLCVVLKRVDLASYMAIENYKNGIASGTQYSFSLGNDGIDLVDSTGNLEEEALATISVWKKKIIDDKLVVPYDAATFAQFFIE